MLRGRHLVLVVVCLASACSSPFAADQEADRRAVPKVGACRDLTASDLDQHSNSSRVVPCSQHHTAETFAAGALPATTGSAYSDKRHARFVYRTCQRSFAEFIGADESLALRVRLSWVWFRPSERGWSHGARWYRCDLVGGPIDANRLSPLPAQARGLLERGDPDDWMACADGATVARGAKVPCSRKHTWRAVTTIKLGGPDEPYPGDEMIQARTRSYCQESVRSWLQYPSDYEYGYTWFKADRWSQGNRRSICWARTTR